MVSIDVRASDKARLDALRGKSPPGSLWPKESYATVVKRILDEKEGMIDDHK